MASITATTKRTSRPERTSQTPSSPSFSCLQTTLLHRKCTHISILYIHESPCASSYLHLGWQALPQSSATLIPATPHKNMDRYIAINDEYCPSCTFRATKMTFMERVREKYSWKLAKEEKDRRRLVFKDLVRKQERRYQQRELAEWEEREVNRLIEEIEMEEEEREMREFERKEGEEEDRRLVFDDEFEDLLLEGK